jgi:ribosomal-protein-alanine N-acetyltransferase
MAMDEPESDPPPQVFRIASGSIDAGAGAALATARCLLCPIGPDDVQPLHDLWTSAGVRHFLWDGEVVPIERTRAAVDESVRLFAQRRVGLWGAQRSASADLIGCAGLWLFRDPPELELLYGVAEPCWGQDYAAEIARPVLAYCFGPLGMPVVRASTDAANAASVRVLQKLGFAFVRRATAGGLDTLFFEKPGGTSAQGA